MHQDPQHRSPLQLKSEKEPETKGQSMAPPTFQLKAASAAPPAGNGSSKGGLPQQLVNGFGASTGHDLSDVNVHYNSDKPSQVGALAYAQGSDIHLGAGQEKHLPHEAAHVVQQREGRVKATTQVGNMPVNDNAGLENEADSMGDKASQMKTAATPTGQLKKASSGATSQMKVIQKKDVATDFGTFKSERFDKIGEKGVDALIKFHPDDTKIDAKKIGLAQSVKITYADGTHTGIDPAKENRRVKSGAGQDFVHDRLSNANNPIYGSPNLAAGDGLDKTRESNNYSGKATKVESRAQGGNATYELGHAYKDAAKKQHTKPAALFDGPQGGAGNVFETTALGLEGTDKDKYFGSVKWGYKVVGGKVNLEDISIVSKGNPSANFTESAKLWNSTKTRGTIEVTKATQAYNKANFKKEPLAAGTKGLQVNPTLIGGKLYLHVKLVDAKGAITGKEYYIDQADLKDVGDGSPTANLPIPSP